MWLFKMFCNEEKWHSSTSTQILESVFVPQTIFKVYHRYTLRLSNSIYGILKFLLDKKN